jgi:hypothetical protein
MVLNWNLLVIITLISGIGIVLVPVLLNFIAPATKKIRSLFYIKWAILIMGISTFLDGISTLFMNIFIAIFSAILFIPGLICLSIGINYTIKETYISIHLIIISCLGFLFCYLAFQPGAVEPIIEYGSLSLIWVGLFGILSDLLTIFALILLLYWGFKTWRNAPFLIKKEATIFFMGICIATILSSITVLFRREYHLLSDILLYSFFIIGTITLTYAIIKEPKLFYILPFTVYRILVKDKEGFPLFDHDWSESDISEIMFSGFINAVQLMSEEVMNIGGLVDINLEEGMLIVHESKFITVGLVTSKSSKLLRDALVNFSKDFEQQFERELKQKVRDTSKYENAYFLIDKYFSNFPFRIIPSKRHPLLLSGKYSKVPFELDNKLKNIFADEKEYEAIKAEICKSPVCVSEEFINLYEELKKEIDHLPDNGSKQLNDKKSKII